MIPLCACAAVFGIDDGHPRADDAGVDGSPPATGADGSIVAPDTGGPPPVDGSVGPDGGSNPDSGQTVEAGPSDDGSADASDTSVPTLPDGGPLTCEYVPFNAANGIFVGPGGTDDLGCGTPSAPCLTIQNAINLAHDAPSTTPNVYVADGTYSEALTLASGVSVIGGWIPAASDASTTAWTRDCSAASTTLIAPAGHNVTVTATSSSSASPSKLSTLSIIGGDPSPQPGESAFGVIATGSTTVLTLVWVNVTTDSGASGSPGSTGAGGTVPTGTCAPAADGGAGTPPGTKGTGADAGWFASTGYVVMGAQTGTPGAPGANGEHGGAAGCVTCVTCGGALCGATDTVSNCGTAGQAGCGGGEGQGGTPGGCGGSSVAVLAVDAQIVFDRCDLRAGAGGAGAPGGPGGAGVSGSAGAAGTANPAPCAVSCGGTGVTGCTTTEGAGGGGTAGGHGGVGTSGGPGGDGAGGDSFAVVKVGAAAIGVLDGGATLLYGAPGSGPDGGNGAPGRAGAQGP